MFLLRLILLLSAALIVRRMLRRAFAPRPRVDDGPGAQGTRPGRSYGDLSGQDISDADYEEIP